MSQSKALACCAAMQRAQQPGTDNEMYGRAVWNLGDGPQIGCDMPPVVFCPWCGKRVDEAGGNDAQ